MKIQLDDGLIKEAKAFKIVGGANVALSSTEGDNDELVVTIDSGEADTDLLAHTGDATAAHAATAISAASTTLVGVATDVQGVLEELDDGIADHLADTVGAHNASAITADSTTLVGVGTTVQAVLEELDDSIAALSPALITKRVTFTETAGAGIYTASVVLPAGAFIHSAQYETTAAWDADTTLLDMGFTGGLTSYANAVNVDGTGDVAHGWSGGATGPLEADSYFAAGTTFSAVVTTTGAGGTTGRGVATLVYSVPAAAAQAVKA